jgi:hypothetical protein
LAKFCLSALCLHLCCSQMLQDGITVPY